MCLRVFQAEEKLLQRDLFQRTSLHPLSYTKTKVTYREAEVPFLNICPHGFICYLTTGWRRNKGSDYFFLQTSPSNSYGAWLFSSAKILIDLRTLPYSLQTSLETSSPCLVSQEVPGPCQLPQHKETEPGWIECSHVCPQNLASFPSYITSAFQSYHKQCWNFILVPVATVRQNIG